MVRKTLLWCQEKYNNSFSFRPQNPLIWKNVEIIILPFTDIPWLEKCENYVFLSQKPLDVTNHSVAREVVTFFTLPPGEYIVMPQTNVIFFSLFWFPLPGDWVTFNILIWCCQVPNCDGKFLLRILTDEQSNIWWAWQDNEIKSWLFRLFDKRDNGQIDHDLLWILGRWTKTMSWSEMFSWNSKTVSNMWVLSSPRIHNKRTFWLVVMSNDAALVYGTDSTGSLGNASQLV